MARVYFLVSQEADEVNFLPPLLAVSLPFWIQAFLNMVKHRDVSPKWQLHSIKFSLEVKSSGVGSNFHGKKSLPPSAMEGGHKQCNHSRAYRT